MTTTQPGADPAPDPRRWRALAVCLVAGFMTLLDVSIVNVALPSIRSGLHASESDLQWIVSGYALTYGLVLVPAGRIGDSRGRRPVFLFGFGMFTLFSAVCGLAPGPGWLVVARLCQGASGGVLTPQVAGLLQELFQGRERGRAFGYLGTSIGLSTAVGPLVGGLIIRGFGTSSGWRWVFFVNLPVGLIALPLARAFIPLRRTERSRQDLDPVGVLLLGLAVVSLLIPFVEEQTWHSEAKWLLLPAAAGLLGTFIAWERRYARHGSQPVVDLGLFGQRSYTLGATLALIYFAGFTGIIFIISLYLQSGVHYSALQAGLSVMPFAIGSGTASGLGGRRVNEWGRRMITTGLGLVLVGTMGVWYVAGTGQGRHIGLALAAPLLVAGVGSGLVIAPNQALSLSRVEPGRSGAAAGVLQTGQRVGAAAGIAAIGSVFFGTVMRGHGAFTAGFRDAFLLISFFVLAALALGLSDLALARRRRTTR